MNKFVCYPVLHSKINFKNVRLFLKESLIKLSKKCCMAESRIFRNIISNMHLFQNTTLICRKIHISKSISKFNIHKSLLHPKRNLFLNIYSFQELCLPLNKTLDNHKENQALCLLFYVLLPNPKVP